MSAPRRCPCCGADTGGEYPPTALLSLPLSPQREGIIRMLIDAYPGGVLDDSIKQTVGGTRGSMQVQRKIMRHQLASLGWATQSRKGVVRLVRI